VKIGQPPTGVFVAEIMVKVRPEVWSLRLSTKPSTIPETVAGLAGNPVPVKAKLKLRADAAPAWRQVASRAALRAPLATNLIRWGREGFRAAWPGSGAEERRRG
jgi:hypothetical protein